MSAATTGKFLFCSFIFFGNCHYQEKKVSWELYKHTEILDGYSASNLSQTYSLLAVDILFIAGLSYPSKRE